MKALMISMAALFCVGTALADDCCKDGKKAEAKATCAMTAKKASSCGSNANCGEDAFMAEAKKMYAMAAQQETGKEACCKSTEEKPMSKGDKGCCNAPGESAKFKVFVAGVGYKYFGCEGSAAKGRKELLAKHGKVGKVQKVAAKAMIH